MPDTRPRIEVTGVKEFRAAVRRMGGDLKEFTRINKAAAEIVARQARQNAPRNWARLAGSIRAGARQTRGYVNAGNNLVPKKLKRGGRNAAVPYAGPIHYGWPARNIAAQPFLLDAMDQTQDQVVKQYREMIDDLVVRVGRESSL